MEEQIVKTALIFKPEDCLDEMLHDFENGKEKGTTTHIREIDKCWTWRKGEFNIWTGYSNEGKSLFVRFLCIVKALMDNWKFIFCAPEDYPAKEFFDDMIHTIVGLPTDRDNPHCMDRDTYLDAFTKIKDNFIFLYMNPPHNTIKGTLVEMSNIMVTEQIDGIVIDPLIKFARPKDMSDRDDIYAAYITTLMTDFARIHNVSANLVMHQLTPKILESGFYPKPSMYTIKGGGTWSDGTDNILSIWRPLYAKNKMDEQVIFTSQKIKKQKLVGIPQEYHMAFDRRSNRYLDQESRQELFNFNKV
jgi:twinkle protein